MTTTPIERLREALDWFAARYPQHNGAGGRLHQARAALDELAAQLSAQPKALEWREPSTAPLDTDVVVIMRAFGVVGMGERTDKGWRLNTSLCPEHYIAGWMPLDALPPAPKGESDG